MSTESVFDGRASEMRDSPWLAAEDLDGLGEITLTIAKVYKHKDVEFEAGRKKPLVFAVGFEKAKRQLVLNGTNRKKLQAMFGNDVKKWVSQKITLHVIEGIKVGRETKRGLRIK